MNFDKVKIEKGVELPKKQGGSGRTCKYPFIRMDMGDSFQFECGESDYTRIRAAAYSEQLRSGTKFTFRKIGENSYRCWRIK